MSFIRPLSGLLLLVVSACGGNRDTVASEPLGPAPNDGGASVNLDGGGGTPPPVGTWGSIVEHGWQVSPDQESYWCRRVKVTQDAYIVGFRAVSPQGTHHLTLAVDDGPLGAFPCTGVSVGTRLLYGAGVGTEEFDFPPGVAVKIKAGDTLLLNLHLYNVHDTPLAGTSGVEVLTADPSTIEHEAFDVLAGKGAGLKVVPGLSTQTGSCTVSQDTTLLSVAPHMHLYGTHQRVFARPPRAGAAADAGSPVTLLDRDYQFGDQHFDHLSPAVVLPAGGSIDVECTYQNGTPRTLTFGESTRDEMCFTNVYHYPAMVTTSMCTR